MRATTEIPIGARVHVRLGRSEYDGVVIDTWQPNGAVSTYYDVRDDKTSRTIFGVAEHQIGEGAH